MMWCLWFLVAAHGMTLQEAVQAGVERSPATAMSASRVDEAKSKVWEARGHLLPSASLSGAVVAQTPIEVDISQGIEFPIPLATPIEPLVVMPGQQLQGSGVFTAPLVAPMGWAGARAANHGLRYAERQQRAEEQALTAQLLQAFHASAQAHDQLVDAQRAEALAERLLSRGQTLLSLGAVASDQVLPFERALATARAGVALTTEGAAAADGVLQLLTGLSGAAEPGPVPRALPDLGPLLAQLDRPDIEAAEGGAEAAGAAVRVAQAGRYPTVGLQGAVTAVDPAPDFGKDVIWRVALGATVPLFQGGTVNAKVGQARAQAARASAGARMARQVAEFQVRQAHGALAQALSALVQQDEAVRLAQLAVVAAEARVNEGGGSLLQLQQAQLELVRAEASRTQARGTARRAADQLELAVHGGVGRL